MQLNTDTTLQNGKYRIIRVLGQGGFGITYLAENVLLEQKIALKEFFPKDFCGRDNTSHLTLGTQNNAETVAKLRERFLKEAKNIAKLHHPGIVGIHDVFEENNTAYYVMDFIDGESLKDVVKRKGPLSEEEALALIEKVSKALEYIHSRHMTHFDVKPANVMIRKDDGAPILIDFGLSKQYDAKGDATSTLMQAVSHGFSPIELYNTGAIQTFSPQTDVYSLGATLYFLITGKVPPTASQLLEEELEFPAGVSPNVRTFIEQCMAVSRTKRPATIPDAMTLLAGSSSKAVRSKSSTTSKAASSAAHRVSSAAASDQTLVVTPESLRENNNGNNLPPVIEEFYIPTPAPYKPNRSICVRWRVSNADKVVLNGDAVPSIENDHLLQYTSAGDKTLTLRAYNGDKSVSKTLKILVQDFFDTRYNASSYSVDNQNSEEKNDGYAKKVGRGIIIAAIIGIFICLIVSLKNCNNSGYEATYVDPECYDTECCAVDSVCCDSAVFDSTYY